LLFFFSLTIVPNFTVVHKIFSCSPALPIF
jgi:hypothetical protein